jgi:iron only hydrogenase large subunit-like protein
VEQKAEHSGFHHALKIVDELCIGCTHCMKVCPTEAIRVRDGKAVIIGERCVDCGNCCKACPVSAIVIEQDDFQEIFAYPVRIALVPSVLIGQFPSYIGTEEIFAGMRHLGFTHIFEIDSVVEIVQQGYDRFIEGYRGDRPVISSFCPAVIRLIQVRFPSLVGNLIRVKPPSDVAAIYCRRRMEEQGYVPGQIGIYYITPCAAKVASVKSPVGEKISPVNGVINMEYLYNRILHLIMNGELKNAQIDSSANGITGIETGPSIAGGGKTTPAGVLWSLTRGESSRQKGRALAVDGMANVNEFLERLEESGENHIDFLELRACDESCAGGVLISGNRFLTVERLTRQAARLREQGITGGITDSFEERTYGLDEIHPRSVMALDQDRKAAILKMNQVADLLKVLPGIDCAACGSPTCRSLAEDIVQGKSGLMHCIFLQELNIRNGKITAAEADSINASIWGKERDYRSQNK